MHVHVTYNRPLQLSKIVRMNDVMALAHYLLSDLTERGSVLFFKAAPAKIATPCCSRAASTEPVRPCKNQLKD